MCELGTLHVGPVYCAEHKQIKLLPVLKHDPPFEHELAVHLPAVIKRLILDLNIQMK